METVQPFYAGNDATDALARSQYADIHFYMTDDVLVKVDRMSMAHSLEVRCPLLDYRLIEFGSAAAGELKISGRSGQAAAARARGAPFAGDPCSNMPKRGFSIPAARMAAAGTAPDGRIAAVRCLADPSPDLLRRAVVRRMWQEHLRGRARSQRVPVGAHDVVAVAAHPDSRGSSAVSRAALFPDAGVAACRWRSQTGDAVACPHGAARWARSAICCCRAVARRNAAPRMPVSLHALSRRPAHRQQPAGVH